MTAKTDKEEEKNYIGEEPAKINNKKQSEVA
jgi:hypothetical protein